MPRLTLSALILTIAVLAVGCTTNPPAETEAVPPTPQDPTAPASGAYPAPNNLSAPYPGEEVVSQAPVIIEEIPEPAPGKSTITGVLLRGGAADPAQRLLLSLAGVIEAADGTPQLAEFNRATAPNTLTDDSGRFVFADVEPGRYALVVDRITEAFLLNDPQTGGDFLFESRPGEILDLGDLIHPELP